ncbi:hypothetical protein ElyMa_004955700 [Elysia marginata]|uniref:Uncharacterized protein n=1 Tax=Elysia marginata TaxID=1093978 RepID=A0AAV4J0S4_9GAST|nr:hypothetical protein ElyMa_004955700 [Elysia marginata]
MSRMPDTRSNSKSVYQGMVLKRTHRSEYDDNQLRDQARHNTRLDHEIRTVERARNVMAKSMEADKQLFIKSGVQSNIRVTKSRHSATNAQKHLLTSQAAAQHHRLVSDTRVKRSSVSDTDAVDGEGSNAGISARSPKQGQSKATSSSTPEQRQHRDNHNNNNRRNNSNNNDNNNNPNNNNNSNTNAKGTDSKDAISAESQPSDSLYDSFLLGHLSESAMSKAAHTLATPVRQLDPKSGQMNNTKDTRAKNSPSSADQTAGKSSSSKTLDKRPPLSVGGGDHVIRADQVSDPRRASTVQSKAKTGSPLDRAGQTARTDNSTVRTVTKWDSLATPKYSSPQMSKRAQIEQEFSRPTNRNSSSSSPASEARLLGTYTLAAGASTPTPVHTSASAAVSTSASSSSTQRKKSAQHGRKQ